MSIRSRMMEERLIILLSGAATIVTALMLIVIIGSIAIKGLPGINLKYLTSAEVDVHGYGSAIGNALIGTIYLSALSVIIATPLALCVAIYLKKYARDNGITRILRLLIEMFSGTPSIIIGIVGLILICYYLKPISGGWSLLSASVSLAILIMPVLERSIEESIGTVPAEIEEGSYALGATKWDTIRRITVPYAMSGILTGVVMGVGRSAEESAVVLLTTGYSQYFPTYGICHNDKLLFGLQIFPFQDQIGSLSIAIYNGYQLPTQVSQDNAFSAAFVLIMVVLLINLIARLIIRGWKIGFSTSIRKEKKGQPPNPKTPGKPRKDFMDWFLHGDLGNSNKSKKRDEAHEQLQEPSGDKHVLTTENTPEETVSLNSSLDSPKIINLASSTQGPPAKPVVTGSLVSNNSYTEVGDKTNPSNEVEQKETPQDISPETNKAPGAGLRMESPITGSDFGQNSPGKVQDNSEDTQKTISGTSSDPVAHGQLPIICVASGQNKHGPIGEKPISPTVHAALEVIHLEKPGNTRKKNDGEIIPTPPKKSPQGFKEWFLHGDIGGGSIKKTSQVPDKNAHGDIQPSADTPSEEEIQETIKPAGIQAKFADALKPLKLSKKQEKVELLDFNIGALTLPGMDRPIKETNITYPLDPPYQFINIKFNGEELTYNVLEPPLSEGEIKYMNTIEKSLEKLISTKIIAIKPEEREDFLRTRFSEIIRMYGYNLSMAHQDRIFFHLRKRYLGLDKIDAIMKDHYIEDISCNGPNNYLYVYHRVYGSVRTNVSYEEVELNKFVMRLAQISSKHISILQPIKDVSMPDGSRANLTLGSEVTKKGATFTIRKFRDKPMSPVELLGYKSIDSRMLAYIWILLDYKRSVLVSGGTASGKTTLMNVFCSFIRPELKIVSLEDTAELNLVHPNWIQSVTRSGFGAESGDSSSNSVSGVSGVSAKTPGDIGMYDLLVAALRQRPEYIIVGEVRGAEAFTLFQAIAVGHACMGTIHAGNMRELLSRVESNPMNVPRTLFSAMDAVCFSAMIRRGDRNIRRVMSIMEVLELDPNGDLITNPVFRWDAFTDKFVFSGKSHIFEKIEAQLGIKEEALINEMEERSNFLTMLGQKNITDYADVVENIREYILNK